MELKNQKMNNQDLESITRKVNSIDKGVDVVCMLLSAYKKEVGIMEKDLEVSYGDEENFDFDVETLDKHITHEEHTEKTIVRFKISDKDIMESLITDFVLSGYKVSARGNILLVEDGREKIQW